MSELTVQQVLNALRGVIDPDLGRDIVALGFVTPERVAIEGGVVRAQVELTTPACPVKDQLRSQCEALILALPGVERAEVTMTANTASARRGPATENTARRLENVKNIIAVGSGKGGVGKSTVAANVALTLRATGATVGLLDADIYGPSIPIMMGTRHKTPVMTAEQKIQPIERYGLETISMGFLLGEGDAVVWRGPMLGKALQQFIEDVAWSPLDYLIIDLPPGTGDVQLSLAQLVPLDGAIVVTTPQDLAFADVRRAMRMFQMTHVPVLGLVENMSYFVCPDNGKRYYIFGEGRTEKHAEAAEVPFLGQLPLDMAIGPAADRGEPIVIGQPDGEQAQLYRQMVGRVASDLSKRHLEKERKSGLKDFFKVRSSSPPT